MEPTTTPKKLFKTFATRLLLLFLVVTFAVWGIGDIARGGPQTNVAKVGERRISIGAFGQELQEIRSDAEGKMPDELLNSTAFSQQVLAKLVQNALVEESATQAGIVIAEDAVADKLRSDPYFQDLKGKFNADMFRQFLASQRITEGQFVDSISRQTRAQTMVAAYQMDQVNAMPALAALEAFSEAETRDVFLATIARSAAASSAPSDVELHAFYDANSHALFMQPESRDIISLNIRADDVKTAARAKADTNVSDATAVAAYVQTLSDSIDDVIASGTEFSDVSGKLPVSTKTQKLTNVLKDNTTLDSAVLAQAFALDQGQASSVITLANGDLAVVYLARIHEAEPKPFEEVADDVKRMVTENAQARTLSEKAHALAAALQGASNDDARMEIAKNMGANAQVLKNIGRKDAQHKTISLSLRAELFSKKAGEFIAPAPFDGGMVVPVVSAIYAPKDAPKPSEDASKQALRIVQGVVSNGLLNDFENNVPVTVYGLPETGAQ